MIRNPCAAGSAPSAWRACWPMSRRAAAPDHYAGHYTGPHFPPKAKHNIFLFLVGGPSQLDMFDPKPALAEIRRPAARRRRTCAPSALTGGLLPSPFEFKRYGQSGVEVSELLPQSRRVHRRHLRHPLDVHLQSHPHAGAQPVSLRQHRSPPGPPWAPGSPTAGHARTRTCPASWC